MLRNRIFFKYPNVFRFSTAQSVKGMRDYIDEYIQQVLIKLKGYAKIRIHPKKSKSGLQAIWIPRGSYEYPRA
jgi:hypothetical protein